jgi:DNA-binding GntR family transcriptional regulator
VKQEFEVKAIRYSALSSVTELVFGELYDRIVGLQLLPGTKISQAWMHHAIFIRTALELEALRMRMAKVDTKAIHLLEENFSRQKEAIRNDDQDQFHELDDGLHALICNNKAHMDRVPFFSFNNSSKIIAYEKQTKILNAIRLGDTEQAVAQMRTHLERFGKVVTTIRAEHDIF